jgi:hypothetical protein
MSSVFTRVRAEKARKARGRGVVAPDEHPERMSCIDRIFAVNFTLHNEDAASAGEQALQAGHTPEDCWTGTRSSGPTSVRP